MNRGKMDKTIKGKKKWKQWIQEGERLTSCSVSFLLSGSADSLSSAEPERDSIFSRTQSTATTQTFGFFFLSFIKNFTFSTVFQKLNMISTKYLALTWWDRGARLCGNRAGWHGCVGIRGYTLSQFLQLHSNRNQIWRAQLPINMLKLLHLHTPHNERKVRV